MKNTKLRNSLLLVLTALIWGSSFVAQRQGGSIVGPFTFNCVRSIIGGIVLIPVIAAIDKVKPSPRKPQNAGDRKILLIGGLCCGTMLFLASTMQQLGMFMGTTAGKSGFLTACYILIVPVLGIFFKRKCSWNIWRAVSLMRERIVKSGSIGSGNTCMCAALCGTHYGNRSFFTVGGWCETFMYTVFCMRNIGIFPDGVLRNHTGRNGCLDINIRIITGMDCIAVFGRYVMRSGIYIADNRTERT